MECREYAVKLLSVKDRTERELRERLEKKGYSAEEIDDAVAVMTEYNYIDDRSYAEKYVSDGINLRGHGFGRIKTELLRRGVSREIADEVIENAKQTAELDPKERIEETLEHRFSGADLGNPKERNRIFGYFARRGFSPRDIWAAINDKCAFKDIYWEGD